MRAYPLLCAALWMLAAAPGATAPSAAHDTQPRSRHDRAMQRPTGGLHVAPSSVFTLGNAARPFGWSTAVGDFDGDGTPDVAVADHVGRRPGAGGYTYRI